MDDLLTLTRLESSPMPGPSDVEHVNGQAMLKSVVDEARQLATPAHDIVLDADPDVVAHGVSSELYSAFFNLIANAIRYSPDGGAWRSAGEPATPALGSRSRTAASGSPRSTSRG